MVAVQAGEEEQILVLAVCYIPPELSSHTAGSEDILQALAEGVEMCNSWGH